MMADLVLRPWSIVDGKVTDWCLQIRRAGMPATEYVTLCRHLSETDCREIVEAGKPFWLFGDPRKDDPDA